MNINHDASEIDTDVKSGERYACRVARKDDDRAEALSWYFRKTIRHALENGASRQDLCSRLGITKGYLSQLESGKVGIGVPKLIIFAERLGEKPGEMLDKALEWWPKRGREEKARVAKAAAEEAERELRSGTDAPPESGPKGSERPSKRAG